MNDENKKKMCAPDGVEIRVGQVWVDMDKRHVKERRLTVVTLLPQQNMVVMSSTTEGEERSRNVTIRVDRLRPGSTGYRRVVD